MNWQVDIRPAALTDIENAADWYEQRSAGLGTDFVARVRSAMADLNREPEIPRLRHVRLQIRWVYPKRFPYRIIYRATNGQVIVLGVMHAARSDARWKERL
jgi:toxin ParE1/3/4